MYARAFFVHLIPLFAFLAFLPADAVAEDQEKFVLEGLLARVGEESVQLTDLQRFKSVENIMQCIGLRTKVPAQDAENLKRTLARFVDEELIFFEARAKLADGSVNFQEAIRKIKAFPACISRWRSLGEKYAQLYSTKANNLAGEGMLVRELEKRLLIDYFAREKIGMDMKTWLQEARVKIAIKYYLE